MKNALKFTQSGQINIKVSYNNTEQLLIGHVKDTGSGISENDMPKLFTRFGRLHRTAQMNSGGIGLGLLIVKEIVEKSGGMVTVLSKGVDQGSVFIFSMRMEKVN